MPSLEAGRSAVLGNATDHLERPVDGRHEVDFDDPLEAVSGIDPRLAGFLVDPDREIVAGDAGRRHADAYGVDLAADGVEHGSAKSLVGHIAPIGIRDRPT